MQGVPVSKASAIISKEWKKVKTSEKKMKKYKDLYKEEKQPHEEALQRYQEDHADEMKIINLHKRCNKKVPQPKKVSKSFKSDEPKKYQSPLMIQARKNRGLKKSMQKMCLQKQEKKLKRPHNLKKY